MANPNQSSSTNQPIQRGGQQGESRSQAGGGQIERRERRGGLAPFGFGGSPFSLMRWMFDDLERAFESFGAQRGEIMPRFGGALERFGQGAWAPQIEVFERGDQFVVRADLPGLTKNDVNVELTDEALVLSGERKYEQEEKKEGLYRSERSYGSFYRAIPLPEGVSGEDVKANFNNGVLEVSLKRAAKEAKTRRIDIQEGASGQKTVH